MPCTCAAAYHHLDPTTGVRWPTRQLKHTTAARKASGGVPRSTGPYSMPCECHLTNSCSGADWLEPRPPPPPHTHPCSTVAIRRAPNARRSYRPRFSPPLRRALEAWRTRLPLVTRTFSGALTRIPVQPLPPSLYAPVAHHEHRRAERHWPYYQYAPPPCTSPRLRCHWRALPRSQPLRGLGGAELRRYPSPHRSHTPSVTAARCKPVMSKLGTLCQAVQRVGHCGKAKSQPWPSFVDLSHRSGSTRALRCVRGRERQLAVFGRELA